MKECIFLAVRKEHEPRCRFMSEPTGLSEELGDFQPYEEDHASLMTVLASPPIKNKAQDLIQAIGKRSVVFLCVFVVAFSRNVFCWNNRLFFSVMPFRGLCRCRSMDDFRLDALAPLC